MRSIILKPLEIFYETEDKFKAPSKNVQKIKKNNEKDQITLPTFLMEICPVENFSMEFVSTIELRNPTEIFLQNLIKI